MILHLHTDSRFANYTIEVFGKENSFHLIGLRYPNQELRFVTKQSHVNTYVFGWNSPEKLLAKIKPAMVVVHFMDIRWYEFLSVLPKHIKLVWIFWGGDGYSLPKMSENLYDKYTSQGFKHANTVSKLDKMKAELGIKSVFNFPFFASLTFEFLRKRRTSGSSEKIKNEVYSRVNYCGTFLKEDYELLQSKYAFSMKWIDARFISLEQLIGNSGDHISGNNILIGNSCTMENNHVDAFQAIQHINLDKGQQVICPLSYGKDLGKYRDWIVEEGNRCFGQSFEPLMQLMPLNEYTQVLRTCSHAIMHHNRQQAFNNVLALVYLGVKVYLKPENTIYSFLKRIGCHVYSMNELNNVTQLTPLSSSLVDENRKLLRGEFSQQKIRESAVGIVQLATKKDG